MHDFGFMAYGTKSWFEWESWSTFCTQRRLTLRKRFTFFTLGWFLRLDQHFENCKNEQTNKFNVNINCERGRRYLNHKTVCSLCLRCTRGLHFIAKYSAWICCTWMMLYLLNWALAAEGALSCTHRQISRWCSERKSTGQYIMSESQCACGRKLLTWALCFYAISYRK